MATTYRFADKDWSTAAAELALAKHFKIDASEYPRSWRWRTLRKCYYDFHTKTAKGFHITRCLAADTRMLCTCSELPYYAKRLLHELIEAGEIDDSGVFEQVPA